MKSILMDSMSNYLFLCKEITPVGTNGPLARFFCRNKDEPKKDDVPKNKEGLSFLGVNNPYT